MASSFLAAGLSRHMSRLSLSASKSSGRLLTGNVATGRAAPLSVVFSAASPLWSDDSQRTMATNRKVIDAKNAKRLKIQQKKKKNTTTNKVRFVVDVVLLELTGVLISFRVLSIIPLTVFDKSESSLPWTNPFRTLFSPEMQATASDSVVVAAAAADGSSAESQPFLQHQEWVKFQQSISVSGFQTGQVTTATVLKKSRGGKQARRKREKELARLRGLDPSLAGAAALEEASSSSAVANKFPAIRYSPEETEELLRQAYEALPERTGKRGTRNLRRQAERWKRVRKIRSDYKANIVQAHERRMEHRHYKRQRVVQAKDDATVQRQNDLEYQGKVLERWYRMQNPLKETLEAESGFSQNEGGVQAKS